MQGTARSISLLKHSILQHSHMKNATLRSRLFPHFECIFYTRSMNERGLDNTTIADVLKAKGDEEGSLHWCSTDDTVYDAVKHMTQSNVGSLVVVKPGEKKLVAGIITERDYLKKIIVQGRSSKMTKVGEIMTDENKLVTVTTDTNILQAMQVMTDKHIRHMPVIDKKVVGMISIVDVVRAVVEQQGEEMKHLNEFIKGDYY